MSPPAVDIPAKPLESIVWTPSALLRLECTSQTSHPGVCLHYSSESDLARVVDDGFHVSKSGGHVSVLGLDDLSAASMALHIADILITSLTMTPGLVCHLFPL